MEVDIVILVGMGGLFVAILGYVLNRDRDKKNNAISEAEMKVTLAHISRGVDEIKLEVKTNREQMSTFSRDLARIDEVAKLANKRLDKLEATQNNED